MTATENQLDRLELRATTARALGVVEWARVGDLWRWYCDVDDNCEAEGDNVVPWWAVESLVEHLVGAHGIDVGRWAR